MTPEEFNVMTAADTDLIRSVNKLFIHHFIPEGKADLDGPGDDPFKKYLWSLHETIDQIDHTISDIMLSQEQLLIYRPGKGPLLRKGNDARMIRYHYENFLLRTSKIKDLALSLIITAMQLPVTKKNGREGAVKKALLATPEYGDFGKVWSYMDQMTGYYKPFRNHLAHNGSLKYKDLSLLETFYRFNIPFEDIKKEFRYVTGMKSIQIEVVNNCSEHTGVFLKNADTALKALYIYLLKPAIDNMHKLSSKP